ncbi:alpha-galactosidase [Bifidobacterium sp. 81T8]|nr:alpha-galactosidase [Bifidobacterium simiiventris]
MVFLTSRDAPVKLAGLSGRGMGEVQETTVLQRDPRPIVELRATNTGAYDNRLAYIDTVAGSQLRFVKAEVQEPQDNPEGLYRLEITQFASYRRLEPSGRPMESTNPALVRESDTACEDARDTSPNHDGEDGVTVVSVFETYPNLSAVRTYTVVRSPERYPIEAVSSMQLTLPMDANASVVDRSRLYWGDNAWAAENDWHVTDLRDLAIRDRNQVINPGESSSRFAMSSASTWSTGVHQPAGILEGANPSGDAVFSVMWQIEHNGAWEWEVGENDPGLHVVAFGPEYQDHHWLTSLGQGHDFTSVPVSFAIAQGDWQHAVAEMTLQRRALRRAKAKELGRESEFDRTQGLVVYNDYMNTLGGDPTLEKELPLIEGAAKIGADIFCIDAGWYDSTNGGWWDMVGEWAPSTNRFGDAGLAAVADRVRECGMGFGLWLEPEVVGVKSPLAKSLPDEAFFTRYGKRVSDSGRYLLDFRSEFVRDHVSSIVDRLIAEFGVVFFKFDYNTMPGVGTDLNAESVGNGLLDHCRAYLDWLDDLRRRHPQVMIENCGSGAMRADYAQLSRLDLQSTSDQCDPIVYAAIAASAGLTILPEQQGNWGYAQQEMSDETAVFTLVTGILGRLYVSGFINRMDETRLGLVGDAVSLHRAVLERQDRLVPWWPLGLPDFNDDWLVSGLAQAGEDHASQPGTSYMTVWRRSGEPSITVAVPQSATVRQIFPDPSRPDHAPDAEPWSVERIDDGHVRITASETRGPSARVFAVEDNG